MKVGVKVGPNEQQWRGVLEQSQAKYCEVWFRLDQKERFEPLFEYLRQNQIEFGLHFWAILSGGYEPNLAFAPEGIAQESQELMQETLELASKVGAVYVNIHPGSLKLKRLDLDKREMALLPGKGVTEAEAMASLIKRVTELHQEADKLGVRFLTETVPKNDMQHWRDMSGRLNPQRTENISPEIIVELAEAGLWVTNDFGHTAAAWETEDKNWLWEKVWQVSQKLAEQTKLVHLNTIMPPFNGTDAHSGILEKDFEAGAFPNKQQVIELLRLFKNRDDVWVIPEPEEEDMVDNYKAILELVRQV